MGRFLVVAPPLAGHVYPTVPVARALVDRGHEVAWVGYRKPMETVLPAWAELLPVADDVPAPVAEAVVEATRNPPGPQEAFQGVWREYLAPVARDMLPGTERAMDDFRPDVLFVDQQSIVGAVVAERHGVPWATSASTSAEVEMRHTDIPAHIDNPALRAYVTKLDRWFERFLRDLVLDLGLDPGRADSFDPRFSPDLLVGYTTTSLMANCSRFPDHYAFVGPARGERVDTVDFPWDRLDDTRPLVLVSLGTINWRGGERWFAAAVEAVSTMDVQAVFVDPGGLITDPPPNVLALPAVPQLALLERVAAVVCHAGHNTVVETLAAGRPLVVSPIRDDQPVVAQQVVLAGAGVLVPHEWATPARLRAALEQALHNPRHTRAAQRIQASFRSAGGAPAAADRLEDLLAPRT